MYATPQRSPPSCSTTTKHLYPLPLTISSFSLTDICGGNNFTSLCSSDNTNENKQNIINNNNTKILRGDSIEPTCLSKTHDSCSRSIYDYINGHEKLYPSKILDKIDTTLKNGEKKSHHEPITKTQKIKNGNTRHDVL